MQYLLVYVCLLFLVLAIGCMFLKDQGTHNRNGRAHKTLPILRWVIPLAWLGFAITAVLVILYNP